MRSKQNEHDEADRLEWCIIAIGASDFKPRSNQYLVPVDTAHNKYGRYDWLVSEVKRQLADPKPFGTWGGSGLAPTGPWSTFFSPLVTTPNATVVSEMSMLSEIDQIKYKRMGIRVNNDVCKLRTCYIDKRGSSKETSWTLTPEPPPGTETRKYPKGSWYPLRAFGLALPHHFYDDVQTHPPAIMTAWRAVWENWSVMFQVEGSPAVRLLACADSVAGMFRLRDKDSSLTRRQALRHWVRDHRRKMPDGEKIDIAGHLRGAESFDWFGMKCKIEAPARLKKEQS